MLALNTNIRYAVSADPQAIAAKLESISQSYGYKVRKVYDNPPYYIAADHEIVSRMAQLANSKLNTSLAPYVMGGATHTRKLPRAIAFGPGRSDLPKPFPPGRGGAHQPDEAVCLQQIWEAINIYIQAVLMLDSLMDSC